MGMTEIPRAWRMALTLLAAGAAGAADLGSEAELRAALEAGSGTHALTADLVLTRSLPPLPAGSVFTLDGRNHAISGAGRHALFQCPNHGTVLTLDRITLQDGYSDGHGAAVSSGQGLVVDRDIPGFGPVPIMIDGSRSNRVVIRNAVLKGNVSAKSGGAVFVHLEGEPGQPYLLIENTALIGNSVLPGPSIPAFQVNAENNNGGALWVRVQSYRSDVVIRNSTVSGNYAPELGGGILVGESAGPQDHPMPVKILHSTVVGNDCGLMGGAFWNDHSLLLDHSLVHGNTVRKDAAANGANFAGPGPALTVRWSLVGNRRDEHGQPIEVRCPIPVHGYASRWESNNLSADPLLSPLPVFFPPVPGAAAGHSTWLHVFGETSPVRDAGDAALPAGSPTPSWDQRGEPRRRIEAGRIDIGAFEFLASTPNTPPTLSVPDTLRILEDRAGLLALTAGDKETAPESLQISVQRRAHPNIHLDPPMVAGGARSLAWRPAPDYHTAVDGPETLLVVAQDPHGAAVTRTVVLVVESVNDAPALRGPMDTLVVAPGADTTHAFGWPDRVDRGDDATAGLEKAQSVRFHLVDPAASGFFQSLHIDPAGAAVTLTTLPSLHDGLQARVRFRLRDDGGVGSGGVDTSTVYEFLVIIRRPLIPPAKPPRLEAVVSGLLAVSPLANPRPLPSALLIEDAGRPGTCLNCSDPRFAEAARELIGPGTRPGFQPFLITLKANGPLRYSLKFHTTLGEFVNGAKGELGQGALRSLVKDAEGNYAVRLYWWPVSRSGLQAATGSYIVRGTIHSDGPDGAEGPGLGPAPRPIGCAISAIFGHLR